MNEEDYKAVIASYQQKAFELFNQNIVLETQISSLRKTVEILTIENEKLKKVKKPTKQDAGDFV
jgi:hypothetical protein